ncbi:MAG: serine/threonine protein kinase [Deltaproteobacteria bacterium]|nr:serine/threonine protein kinase [Deltaproteobacteria bacterium]
MALRSVRRLGRGGMAEVWLAEDERGDRVALKRVLPEHAADPRFRRMFLDEAAIARALDHPGIVRVLRSGEDDGTPWIAMELVDGLDAAHWMEMARERGAALPEVAALRIAADVARALHAAHEARDEAGTTRGIVHRDVSPGNVLVARDGSVKLSDFGIAKARDRLEKTSAGATKGKMAFMAPEQMLGAELDRRTDVFGLGCTLHALLTGRSALADEGDTATLMGGGELPLDPRLADDVRAIVARSVASSRVRRWPSAAVMADALEAVLAERGHDGRAEIARWIAAIDEPDVPRESVPARSETPLVRHADGRRRRMAWALGVAIAIASIGAGIGVGLTRAAPEAAISTPAAATTTPARSAPTPRPPAGATPTVAVAAARLAPGLAPPPRAEPAADPVRGAAPRRSAAGSSDHDRGQDERRPDRDRAPDRDRERDPGGALASDPPPSTSATSTALAAPSTGFVVVGGPGALRRVVFVDGARRDFAPSTLELAIGRHAIEVRDPSGATIASRSVEVRADHTRRSPARWIVPAPAHDP